MSSLDSSSLQTPLPSSTAATTATRTHKAWQGLHRTWPQRLTSLSLVFGLFAIVVWLRHAVHVRLGNEAFVTGYTLLGLVAALFALPFRKQRVDSRLGRVAYWQQAHHYTGALSMLVYILHAGWITNGWLESALAIAFWFIAGSGLVSLYINRTAPRLLRAAGIQVLREDIPSLRRDIEQQAYHIAIAAAGKSELAALADHYREHLSLYFSQPRSWLYRIFPNGSKRRALLNGLENVDRYLNESGREKRIAMSRLIQSRDDLDFQSAIQNRIRIWSALHTLGIGIFLVLVVVHVVVAHWYSAHW